MTVMQEERNFDGGLFFPATQKNKNIKHVDNPAGFFVIKHKNVFGIQQKIAYDPVIKKEDEEEKKMYTYQGILFDDADTEEEAKAQLPMVLEAMAEAGYKPTGKEFVYVLGENDDVWEKDKKPAPYREMRHYIWDNHITSCDDFVEYCRQNNPEWAEFLEDPDVRRTAEGFVRFTVLRQGLNEA